MCGGIVEQTHPKGCVLLVSILSTLVLLGTINSRKKSGSSRPFFLDKSETKNGNNIFRRKNNNRCNKHYHWALAK